MSTPDREEERRQYHREWHRKNYARIQADPERRARMLAQKNAARARRRAEARQNPPIPASVDTILLRTYGPWAPLFALQVAA